MDKRIEKRKNGSVPIMLTIDKPSAVKLRKMIINAAYKSKEPHVGSALSIVEIMYAIYFRVANISKENILSPSRDRVILSKGHAALAQYAVLTMKNIISEEDFNTYALDGGTIPAYICNTVCPGIDVSTGMSLGHGLGLAEGIALANRLNGISSRIFVVVGDGELQEGSILEALNSISFMNLSEITVIIDKNDIQASEKVENVIDNSNLIKQLELMKFCVVETDGHNVDKLEKALKTSTDRPLIVVANTIKGCGIKEYENTVKSHYIKIDDDIYKNAMNIVS